MELELNNYMDFDPKQSIFVTTVVLRYKFFSAPSVDSKILYLNDKKSFGLTLNGLEMRVTGILDSTGLSHDFKTLGFTFSAFSLYTIRFTVIYNQLVPTTCAYQVQVLGQGLEGGLFDCKAILSIF
jgi:hypothetical protein